MAKAAGLRADRHLRAAASSGRPRLPPSGAAQVEVDIGLAPARAKASPISGEGGGQPPITARE